MPDNVDLDVLVAEATRIRLHRHDYDEVFVVHGGRGAYIVGGQTIEAGPGDLVVIPAGVLHRFKNLEPTPLQHTAIHATGVISIEWLE